MYTGYSVRVRVLWKQWSNTPVATATLRESKPTGRDLCGAMVIISVQALSTALRRPWPSLPVEGSEGEIVGEGERKERGGRTEGGRGRREGNDGLRREGVNCKSAPPKTSTVGAVRAKSRQSTAGGRCVIFPSSCRAVPTTIQPLEVDSCPHPPPPPKNILLSALLQAI